MSVTTDRLGLRTCASPHEEMDMPAKSDTRSLTNIQWYIKLPSPAETPPTRTKECSIIRAKDDIRCRVGVIWMPFLSRVL